MAKMARTGASILIETAAKELGLSFEQAGPIYYIYC